MVNKQLNPQDKVNVTGKLDGPFDLDACLLQHIGGGLPRNTWTEPEQVVLTIAEDPLPRNTW